MSRIRQTIFVAMWLLSWTVALYLFASGTFWGGVGCLFIALFSIFFQALGAEAGKRIDLEDVKTKAKDQAYQDELNRIRKTAG